MRRIDDLALPNFRFRDADQRGQLFREQSEIWKIPKSALNYIASDRIKKLAIPIKKSSIRDLLNLDEEGNPTSTKTITDTMKKAVCSPRLASLAKPVQRAEKWNHIDEYELTRVPSSALKAVATPRLTELAQPRKLPKEYYKQYKPRKKIVPKPFVIPLSPVPSRIARLAIPVPRGPPDSIGTFDKLLRERFKRALRYKTTDKDENRSQPIPYAPGYMANKTDSELMLVSQNAMEYNATERINDLARPKPKRLDLWQQEYNPDAFVVSRAALVAVPSERIKQLSQPTPRIRY